MNVTKEQTYTDLIKEVMDTKTTKRETKRLIDIIAVLNAWLDLGKIKAEMFNGEEIDFFSYEFDDNTKQFVVVAH